MERLWNYLFYTQWRFLNRASLHFIQKPLSAFVSFLLPAVRKKKKEIDKVAASTMNNAESGFNLGFAFSQMFITTTVLLGIICLYVTILIDYETKENFDYFFFGVIALSLLINYWLIYRKDTYLKYFKEFEKKPFSRWNYLVIVFFHLGIWAFGILSIYWTIGFNF